MISSMMLRGREERANFVLRSELDLGEIRTMGTVGETYIGLMTNIHIPALVKARGYPGVWRRSRLICQTHSIKTSGENWTMPFKFL